MARNVEIKARCRDHAETTRRARALSGAPPRVLVQEDVFFPCTRGRLKLRRIQGAPAELIQYRRSDETEARLSDYLVVPTEDPDGLQEALQRALGRGLTVRKRRELFLVGQTRIHLDRVEELGDFLELEVVLRAEQSLEEGRGIAEELAASLGIEAGDRVARAYVDLLGDLPG